MKAGRRQESPWGRQRTAVPLLEEQELDRLAERVEPLIDRLWPEVSAVLGGEDPLVQGAVLADFTAAWLAGHLIPGDIGGTVGLREELLESHIRVVRELIAGHEPDLSKLPKTGGTDVPG